ncbi:MAG: transglutaminase family protein [Rhizobiales bacterium]|nr:transglutaminase family protein [Hyphomicrobiales bacterium]
MRLSIRHATSYVYEQPVAYGVQRLRLTPSDTPGQRTIAWRIEAPGIESAVHYLDAFQNHCHLVSFTGPADRFEVVAEGLVETEERHGVIGLTDDASRAGVFLRETPLTRSDAAIRTLALENASSDVLERLHAIMVRLHEAMTFDQEATAAGTDAREAFALGRGVCQDFSHVFIAAAREIEVPARYVTGYLAVAGQAPAVAQHAWVEAFVAGLGWVGFDPANGVSPSERYVRVACGFDAEGSAPITGTRRGGDGEMLTVDIAVEEAAQ